jgi:hypothetical protein
MDTKYLNVTANSICPAFFINAAKVKTDAGGQWRVTSAPRLCPEWFTHHHSDSDKNGIAFDLSAIEQIMDAGRAVGPLLHVIIQLKFTSKHKSSK